ncbi:MAG: 3-deoxy-7-phosphoheptulonate synthase [Candidatus Hydrogenedentota bacterium]|jgi:3-deoxy-7-phosphoheptulonate synthase|uniref:2-keto-3-deoxy-D-arabino-heptulosonate-7-phosphate synthase I beta n=1 Tax=Sumerlaea chitinivorans TaxID=2250252 RepID=A0A2Z4Y282_SUMC1|nr:2-keto-3-deoxy-D-arabino-heptulosonate-7-phosphate synthase I beta [Candidatus Sumerlaea chitinivorans]RMH28058.1 MAG: 3-deoxy-7-phosphoheptulonate synthase [Candidatus Hydrogenedentota bacterium]GIX45238.1 MAG: 3-deoxy-7-phosphoheptulonate synthase [Candidatus Sumerlaea sp.]
MIIVLKPDATEEQLQHLVDIITEKGLRAHISRGVERTVVGCIGDETKIQDIPFLAIPGVESAMPIVEPYKLASRTFRPEKTKIRINDIVIGGNEVVIVAGPCSVEPNNTLFETARAVKAAGAKILRGGAFKPRTSPYDFCGLGEEGLRMLDQARQETGLAIVTEVMDTREVELVYRYADAFQIGARNSQNFNLLREVGKYDKPVFLKRGMSMTIKELLMSAEYIISQGNPNVILVERGIRTFETATRNTLDIAAVPVLHEKTHLPVFVDPSHAAGDWRYVTALACAAVACGADGLMVEVHPNPERAFSDGAQSLKFEKFDQLMNSIRPIAQAIGRAIQPAQS